MAIRLLYLFSQLQRISARCTIKPKGFRCPMLKTRALRFAFYCLVPLSLTAFLACSHKGVKPDDNGVSSSDLPNGATAGDSPSSDAGNAMGLQTVHFAYDSSLLTADAKSTLKANAAILKSNPSVHIQIEGHCDQRGGIQYNIALGEKRANSAKHYLQDLGISDARITTISYGKERLLDPAETEEAYAKNRRANFVITKSLASDSH